VLQFVFGETGACVTSATAQWVRFSDADAAGKGRNAT